eukprot:1157770-Pelagomonas_calceolata.AAC.9
MQDSALSTMVTRAIPGEVPQRLRQRQFAGSAAWPLGVGQERAAGVGSANKRRLFLGDVVLMAR